MGTNYYIVFEPCEKCGRSDDEYHIGKSSVGWCFSLHVDPDKEINTLENIKRLWEKNIIRDEYRAIIQPKEMLSIINDRKWDRDKSFIPPYGYKSWNEFHEFNHSEFGPNGLLRHKIDGRHCIGHGDGTYDFINGEFS